MYETDEQEVFPSAFRPLFFVASVFNTHIIQTLAMVLPPSLQSVAVVNLCSRAAIGGLAELTKFNAIS